MSEEISKIERVVNVERKKEILDKSVRNMPQNPSTYGYSTSQIRKYFYEPIEMTLDLMGELEKDLSSEMNGVFPLKNIPFNSEIEIEPNIQNDIAELTQNTTISFKQGDKEFANNWVFIIKQGNTAYNVTLPNINWGIGVAPTFDANTMTYCFIYYIGETLCGEWRVV